MTEKNEIQPQGTSSAQTEGQNSVREFRMEKNPTDAKVWANYSSADPEGSDIQPEVAEVVDGVVHLSFKIGPKLEELLRLQEMQVIPSGTRLLVLRGGMYAHMTIEQIEALEKADNPVDSVAWHSGTPPVETGTK